MVAEAVLCTAEEMSLKDKGNVFFKAGNYLKASALYTQAIKQDPSNPTLYSNRAAAFLQLVKLNKALGDAETTITLNPQDISGKDAYWRPWNNMMIAFQTAWRYNPQSAEVSRKIKRVSQLAKGKKRAEEVENMRSNVDMAKHLDALKFEMSEKYEAEEYWKDIFSFLIETMEIAVKSWMKLLKWMLECIFFWIKRRQTLRNMLLLSIGKAFESPHTHSNCSSFLRQYAEDLFSSAACLVVPTSIISYPQVWKGQGSTKWKHEQHDGFFVQFESPLLQKIWFLPSSNEKGQMLCRDSEVLNMGAHEVLPRLFKHKLSNS